MRVTVLNMAGEKVNEIELRDDIFGLEPHEPVMHQAMLRQLANARLGTADTKTRGEVSGGGRKPWRQKHTGRARQGSTRSPNWRHGGIVFGPHPRSYRTRMPRKMRRLALKSALSVKAAEESLVVVDALALDGPKTNDFLQILDNLKVASSALVLLSEHNENVERSARNVPDVKMLQATCLNLVDILQYDTLILPVESVAVIERILG